jgi:hypothetical protein
MWTGVRRETRTKDGELQLTHSCYPVDLDDLLGHEPDAALRYRVVRHLGSSVLAAYDASE